MAHENRKEKSSTPFFLDYRGDGDPGKLGKSGWVDNREGSKGGWKVREKEKLPKGRDRIRRGGDHLFEKGTP